MVCTQPRVMIVDDEQVVCDVLSVQLSDHGYLCTSCLNGEDALTKLVERDFDLALVDIKLPRMSGLELLRKITSDHHTTATVMITAVRDIDTVVEAMKLGASDYIVKPFDLCRITTSIRTVLETKKRLPEKRGYKIPLCVDSEAEDKQATEESFHEMNAIAFGVETRLDLLTGHSNIVTQGTIDVARRLGIAEEEIQRWAAARAGLYSDRNRRMRSSLNKLQRSPLACYRWNYGYSSGSNGRVDLLFPLQTA